MFENFIVKKTIETLVNGLIEAASHKFKKKISEAFSAKKILSLKDSIERIGRVKTILDPDSIVSLDKIFFEEAIQFTDDRAGKSISFFPSAHTLIEGGPGQGKSMYMRWLCLNEQEGHFIPIFIEFRNLHYKKSLKEELFDAVQDFGIALNADVFEYLAESEKIVFVLDGFDEIPNSERYRAAQELETMARTYPKLRIVVSSRPDSGMGSSVYFSKRIIKNLSPQCQVDFVKHIYSDGDQAVAINNLLSQNSFLAEVTNTPLLLTLFTITYNARQFKPDSLAEFYSLIFPTMLYRHDRLKIGYERERKAKLTDYQMQRLFEALSFISLKNNKTRFPSTLFRVYLENSSRLERIGEDLEDKLIDDITSITALIVRDGYDSYSFSHKSIQEYFSAVFLARMSDNRKERFYSLVMTDFNEYRKWQNSLTFMSIIDEGNYIKYFLVPFRRNSLNMDLYGNVKITYKSLMTMVGSDSKVLVGEDGDILEYYWGDTIYSSLYKEYSEFSRGLVKRYIEKSKAKVASFISFCDSNAFEKYQYDDRTFIITIDAFMKGEKLQKKACKYISEEFKSSELMEELRVLEAGLEVSENIADELLEFY